MKTVTSDLKMLPSACGLGQHFQDSDTVFTIRTSQPANNIYLYISINHKNYNFLACDWFQKVLFSTNSLAKLLSDSLLLDSLLLDSLLSDSSMSQSHSKM